MLLCLPQADICWNVVVKWFAESQIRGKYIAFSHAEINTYNCSETIALPLLDMKEDIVVWQ